MQAGAPVSIEVIAPPGVGEFVASSLRLCAGRFRGSIDVFEMTVSVFGIVCNYLLFFFWLFCCFVVDDVFF